MTGYITKDQINVDCREECPPPHNNILLVTVSNFGKDTGLHDLPCALETYRNPDEYPDERLVGTHWLHDSLLEELFPDDLETYMVVDWYEDCRTGTCPTKAPVLIVATSADKQQFSLLCLECAEDVMERPDAKGNKGVVLHGTHILDDEMLREIYPEDFEDDD